MAYVGNTPAAAYTSIAKQDITGNGGTSYTLDHSVANENEIEVFVNNVRQEPSVAYTVSGTALTMTGDVSADSDFYVVFQGKAIQTTSHPEGQDLQARDGTFSGDVYAVDGTFSGDVQIGTLQVSGSNTKNIDIVSSGGAGWTQGDLRISGSTANSPQDRGQGVYTFNEGTDRTWYAGTLYQDGTSFGIGTSTGATLNENAASKDLAKLTIKSDGKMHIGAPNSADARGNNKIYGMKAPNILTWEDIASTTDGSAVADPETNYYGVAFDPLPATNRWNYDHTPFGGEGIVWRGIANNSVTGAQGGWNTNNFSIDPSYSYVFINFVRRVSSAASGTYYFGVSGGAVVNVGGSNNGANNTNPYFTVRATSTLVRNEWYVDYRTVRSKNTAATGVPKNNGLYRMRDGARLVGPGVSGADCFKWRSDATDTHHRTYLYYASANSGVTLDWYAPAVYKCDGTEPTLSEIFKLYEVTD